MNTKDLKYRNYPRGRYVWGVLELAGTDASILTGIPQCRWFRTRGDAKQYANEAFGKVHAIVQAVL